MKCLKSVLLCFCLAWIIHFIGGSELRVDRLSDKTDSSRRAFVLAEKDGRTIVVPWFQVLYIEEVK